jgi:hypothetical protein
MNNKTNKQRKEEQSLVLFHLPHKSLILKVITRYIHVAYHVHIRKCLQSVETLECHNRRVLYNGLVVPCVILGSGCCFTLREEHYNYIMARTSYISMRGNVIDQQS